MHVITMHVSKGLEFEIVFALGAAAETPSSEEPDEAEAEKLRQLYVALTRAKKRLYIPLLPNDEASSPLDLFWKRSKQPRAPQEIVKHLMSCNGAITCETVLSSEKLTVTRPATLTDEKKSSAVSIPQFTRNLYSYSSLTRFDENRVSLDAALPSEEKTIHTLPRGAETGLVIHRMFERFFSESTHPIEQIVAEELHLASLQDWERAVRDMFVQTLAMPFIDGRTLAELKQSERRAEVEFLFCQAPHYVKGFIDLVVIVGNQLTFFDWKTNWLGAGEESYAMEGLHAAMEPYWLQASLYAEALRRSFPHCHIQEAVYLFVRGVKSSSQGLVRFEPKPLKGDLFSWKE